MRMAGNAVIGWDMGAALQLGTALGISPIAVAELLPPIEAVMVRKINEEMRSGRAERFNISHVDSFAGAGQIPGPLQVHPVFGCRLEEGSQAHRSVRRQRCLTLDQTLNPRAGNTQLFGQRRCLHAQRSEIELGEHFAGMGRMCQQAHGGSFQW
jgi:hypothetical protein